MTPLAAITDAVAFQRPALLAGLLLAAVPLLLAWRGRGRWLSAGARAGCLAMLALAAAGPGVRVGAWQPAPWLWAEDRSASMAAAAAAPLPPAGVVPLHRVAFAAELATDAAPPPSASRVSPVLHLAAARAGELAGVVLHTDGQFTDADWPAAARALGRTALPVWIVPAEPGPADARLDALHARRTATGAVTVAVSLAASSPTRRTVTVTRQGAAAPLIQRTVDLPAGEPMTLLASDNPPPGEPATYRAALSPGDALAGNDTLAFALPPARGQLAVLAPPAVAAAIKAAAGDTGPTATQTLAAEEAPRTPAGWARYAAVVLAGGRGRGLTARARAALAEYVRDGGGLVMLGAGPYGSAADRDDPLNRVLPLRVAPARRQPMKVLVALDASGSMARPAGGTDGARSRFDLAAAAAGSLRRHLTDRDRLAVIAFSEAARLVYDSGDGPADFAAVADALAEVRPSGPTDAAPALKLALDQPVGGDRRGLLIVLSDLQTQPLDVAALAGTIARSPWSLAVAETPPTAEEARTTSDLARLAAAVGADHITTASLNDLAAVFERFLRRSRGPAQLAGPARLGPARAAFGVSLQALPPLGSYYQAAGDPNAELLAAADGQAALARMPVALGRSAMLAAELDDPANGAWLASPAARRLLAAMLRWVRPAGGVAGLSGSLDATARPGWRRLRIDAWRQGRPRNGLKLTALLRRPGQPVGRYPLEPVAPGRYAADLPAGPAAAVQVQNAAGEVVWTARQPAQPPAEFRRTGTDRESLARLAELTGGRRVSRADLPAELASRRSAGRLELAWAAALLAVALMLADWVLARPAGR